MVKQMSHTNDIKKIIIALDYDNEAKVLALCNQLDPNLCRLKIGKQLFTKFGPSIIENLHQNQIHHQQETHCLLSCILLKINLLVITLKES